MYCSASDFSFLTRSSLNMKLCSALSCQTGWQLKAHFRYSPSEHTEPVVGTLSAHLGLTAGSPSSIAVVGHGWFSLRQSKPREAKCTASARPFWFALCVRLFDIPVPMCCLCVHNVISSCLHHWKKEETRKASSGGCFQMCSSTQMTPCL